MNTKLISRVIAIVALVAMAAAVLPVAHAQQSGKKAHAFRGKVQKVDAKNKSLTVDGENVEGWMAAMTMNYKADKDEVYQQVKAGDTITATVYDGDFQTLHEVKVVPAKDAPKK